jgi:hypothetical protein
MFHKDEITATADTDVCMHDPYRCKQLQHMERLSVNSISAINPLKTKRICFI